MIKKIKFQRGFTLIELLVVIAILGVLAAAVLVAINPLEQLARGRDSGRKTTVNQLGHASEAYFTSQSIYPAQGIDWIDTLVTAGEVKLAPDNPSGGTNYLIGCGTANVAQNGICYQTDGVDAIVYVRAESASSATSAGCTGVEQAWVVWSSAAGKTGLTCTSGANDDPILGIDTLN